MAISKDLSNFLLAFGARELVIGVAPGTTFTGSFQGFIVNEDAYITSLILEGGAGNIREQYGITENFPTVYNTGLVMADENFTFSSVTLNNGSIVILTTGSYSRS
jgi:hypothetical protein